MVERFHVPVSVAEIKVADTVHDVFDVVFVKTSGEFTSHERETLLFCQLVIRGECEPRLRGHGTGSKIFEKCEYEAFILPLPDEGEKALAGTRIA